MNTKRGSLACWFACLVACLAMTAIAAAQGAPPGLQEKAAAAKASAARNQQALRSYSWMAQTQVSFKGEVKNTKVESCRYGPDGKVQKTEVSAPPPPQQQKRGLRGKIVEKKTGEMKEEMESAAALIHQYVPPSPDKIQAAIGASKASLAQSGPGVVALTFKDYVKAGDSLTLTFESEVKALRQINVNTYLDDPGSPVTLQVDFQSLPDGTNYPAVEVFAIPASNLQVKIQNSNYQRVQ